MQVRDVLVILNRAGFVLVRQKSSHRFLQHPNGTRMVISWGDREKLGMPAIRKIEKQSGVSLT